MRSKSSLDFVPSLLFTQKSEKSKGKHRRARRRQTMPPAPTFNVTKAPAAGGAAELDDAAWAAAETRAIKALAWLEREASAEGGGAEKLETCGCPPRHSPTPAGVAPLLSSSLDHACPQ